MELTKIYIDKVEAYPVRKKTQIWYTWFLNIHASQNMTWKKKYNGNINSVPATTSK